MRIEVTAVRYWSLADATRVAIEISGDAHVRSDRIENPDRIFFDLVGARPLIDGRRLFATEVGDKLVKRIRVAETAPDVTRVVLDLEVSGSDFAASHPNRIVVELRPRLSHREDASGRRSAGPRGGSRAAKREGRARAKRETEVVRREMTCPVKRPSEPWLRPRHLSPIRQS